MGVIVILVISIAMGVLLSRLMAKRGTGKLLRRSLATLVGGMVFLAALGPYLGNIAVPDSSAPKAPAAKPAPPPRLALTSVQYLAALHRQFGTQMKGTTGADAMGDLLEASPARHVEVVAQSDAAGQPLRMITITTHDTTSVDQLRAALDVGAKALQAAAPDRDFAAPIRSLTEEYADYRVLSPRQIGNYVLAMTFDGDKQTQLKLTAGKAHSGDATADYSTYALTMCQVAVKDRLRAPSTAKFTDRHVIDRDPHDANQYRILGEVDAQNGFGAMLRSYWKCQIGYNAGKNDDAFEPASWNIRSVDIGES